MPRPWKQRRICAMPVCCRFAPETGGQGEPVVLTLDEFEAIRLIDREGLTQEACAAQMNVARATVQAIYSAARTKIACSLVEGRALQITGGSVALCQSHMPGCPHRCGCRFAASEAGGTTMKIAATYENGQIFQHFGHTEHFKLYTVENGAVISSEVVGANGTGHGALAGVLRSLGVDTLICGGIGGGAQAALAEAGIRVYGGVSGDADRAVAALLAGSLDYDPDAHCDHHDHEHGHGEGHACGDHGCGSHSCH